MVIDKSNINPVKELNDTKLEDALNSWYREGFATWDSRGAPGIDGRWGGSLHYIYVKRASKDRMKVNIDFGSVEDYVGAETELHKAIISSGYIISSGRLDRGIFYIRPTPSL